MDLAPSPAAREIIARLEAFMDEHVYPAESVYSEQLEAAGPRSHVLPPVVESLKLEARRQACGICSCRRSQDCLTSTTPTSPR